MEQNWFKYGFWLENRWVQICPVNQNKIDAQSSKQFVFLASVSQTVTDVRILNYQELNEGKLKSLTSSRGKLS